MKKGIWAIGVALVLVIGMVGLSFGAIVDWADWTSATEGSPGSASGIVASYSVTYNGEVAFAQTSGGIYYWIPASTYTSPGVQNPPTTDDIIALSGGNPLINTITFSGPVLNPVMAILSMGNPYSPITYNFNQPFMILSYGPGYFGEGTISQLSGNVLLGIEGHGTIIFPGTYSTISWTAPTAEYWHGFTVGIGGEDFPAAPLPAAVWLLGAGLVGLGLLGRKLSLKK